MARRVFGRKKQPSFLIKKDLPSALLEADNAEEAGVPNLPDEVLYLLQSVKWVEFSDSILLGGRKVMNGLHEESARTWLYPLPWQQKINFVNE